MPSTPSSSTVGASATKAGTKVAALAGSKPGALAQAPSRGPERSVYSLIDNRLSAHVQRAGGLVVLGGSSGFAKYQRFRRSQMPWQLRQTRDGHRVAIMDGKTATVYVPLTAQQAKDAAVLRMRVHNDKEEPVTLRFNGAQDQERNEGMAAGWDTLVVEVPTGLLHEGENEITLFTRAQTPTALEWLEINSRAAADNAAPNAADTTANAAAPALFDAQRKSLVLPRDGGLTYFVMAPEQGRVVGNLDDATCRVQVRATAPGKDAGKDAGATTVTGELVGRGAAVELDKLAGQPIRLELTAAGCDTAYLSDAALVVPGEAREVKRGAPPKYVILWIMDSLRADRVRVFNPKARPETPTWDRLSKTGAMFLQTYVQGNESRVSHASIWSSLYPVKHAMITPKAKLADKWTTVDEVVKKAGMYVSGVGANGYMDLRWGFGSGWNKFSNHIHEKLGLKGQDVLDAAIQTVAGKSAAGAQAPWFLYIGTIDTHVAWRPKDPWIAAYHDPGYKGRFATRFSGQDAESGLTMKDSEVTWVQALYDSNVSYQDDLLRQLLEQLEQWGIADETMLVVTADHGDEQWEHGRVGHGGSLRETLVHVPMLIHYPPLFPESRVTEGAEVIDILPTIADALGQKMDPEWQGQSLLPLAQGVGTGYPRMSMASQYEGTHAARMGVWKLRAPGSAEPNMYRVDEDPLENNDLGTSNAIAYRLLADPLWLLRANNSAWNKSEYGNAANVTAKFPESFGE